MVDSLRNEHNATGRPQNQCPWGCGKIARSRRCAPRHRSPGYDFRRAPGDHRDFASNAVHGGLNQRFLKCPMPSIRARHPAGCIVLNQFAVG